MYERKVWKGVVDAGGGTFPEYFTHSVSESQARRRICNQHRRAYKMAEGAYVRVFVTECVSRTPQRTPVAMPRARPEKQQLLFP
jgi:hypothetical protein